MSEPTTPTPPSDPPPPSEPPPPPNEPPPPPPSGAAPSEGAQPNTVMLVLAYLWILALVPLLVEKEDKEVQWHAKHGIVLLAAEIVLWIALAVITSIPVLNVVGCAIWPIAWLGILVIHVICIVKAVGGQRFMIPGISQYADRF